MDIELYQKFFNHYQIERILDCSTYSSKTYLGDPKDNCRFCGIKREEGKFKTEAHLIPKLLGNQYLLSHFECDDCNALFQKYDDSLSKYLGLYRTASRTKGKKWPKFKDSSSGIQAYVEEDGVVNFILPDLNKLEEAIQTKKLTIVAKNQSYIPLYVYKSVLKMAMSILPSEYVSNFTQTNLFLQGSLNLFSIDKIDIFKCVVHFMPGPYTVDHPVLFLYKRKLDIKICPEFICHLLYKNLSFQLFIPFNVSDSHLFGGVPTTVNFNPMMVPIEAEEEFGPKQSIVVDFNSMERSKDNTISLTFKFTDLKKNTSST